MDTKEISREEQDRRYRLWESEEWQARANRLCREYSPGIKMCRDCTNPVIKGYCCTFCGSVNP